MTGFISLRRGMYFLCRVTCLTHTFLSGDSGDLYTGLSACTATTYTSYGHEGDLIGGNDALVLSADA